MTSLLEFSLTTTTITEYSQPKIPAAEMQILVQKLIKLPLPPLLSVARSQRCLLQQHAVVTPTMLLRQFSTPQLQSPPQPKQQSITPHLSPNPLYQEIIPKPSPARRQIAQSRSFHSSVRALKDHHFDTLKFVQRLQEEGFSEEQSVALMRALSDVIEERY